MAHKCCRTNRVSQKYVETGGETFKSFPFMFSLKVLTHVIDFENFDKNLQN
jgi:hypothetical protein